MDDNSPSLCRSATTVTTMSFLFAFLLLLNVAEVGATQEICKVSKCERDGPPVRFPFWLKDQQPAHCGFPHPGFQLSCTENQQTVLHLPPSVKMFVEDIDYQAQRIYYSDPDSDDCAINSRFPFFYINLSASPFHVSMEPVNYTLFNCSKNPTEDSFSFYEKTCLDFIDGFNIRAVRSDFWEYYNLLNCSKVVDISVIPAGPISRENLYLNWSKPMCARCEAEGKGCRVKNNTEDQTECYDIPYKGHPTKLKRILAGMELFFVTYDFRLYL
ncbi:hypothetical protein SCA6_003715 [Theobroma cacao]